MPTRIKISIDLLLLVFLTTLTYLPGLSGDYAFDDFPNLINNKNLNVKTLDTDSLVAAALSTNSGLFKRPVSMLSFTLNRYFFGIKPYSYKIINLVIHIFTGIGVFFLSLLILQKYKSIQGYNIEKNTIYYLSLFISSIWLIHPINLTSVLYIVQRMTSLSGLFVIWGTLLYIIFRSRYFIERKGFWFIPTILFLFCTLAILSKENGVLLPFFILLAELLIFRFRLQTGGYDKKIIVLFIISILIPTIFAFLILAIAPNLIIGGYKIRDFNLTERLLTESRVLILYIKMILAPSLSELGLYHDDIIVSRSLMSPPTTAISIIIIFSLLGATIIKFKKWPLAAFGVLWFFIAHLLESTFIPLEIAHEHRNYIASFGVIFSISYLLSKLQIFSNHNKLKIFLYLTPIILLSIVTNLRSYQWSDNVLHAVYEARHHPMSARAIYSEARIFANLSIAGNTDKTRDAFLKLKQSSKLYSKNILPDVGLILLANKLGLEQKVEWTNNIKYKLKHFPILPTTISALMELIKCQHTSCKLDDQTINSILGIALRNGNKRHPDIVSISAHHVAYKIKNFTRAEQLYKEAIAISPENIQNKLNLILFYLATKQYEKLDNQVAILKKQNKFGRNNKLLKEIKAVITASKKNTAKTK